MARAEWVMVPAMVHTGIGYDVHPLVAGRKLVLGGVEIAHPRGLEGHSDADVLMHAICDAVLGALGEEDIGHFFPNTDPRWRGVASRIFLLEAARQVAARGGKIINIDSTIIAQEPKVYPYVPDMKINRPADAIVPSPTVLTGICELIMTSISANAAPMSPPLEQIMSSSSFFFFLLT